MNTSLTHQTYNLNHLKDLLPAHFHCGWSRKCSTYSVRVNFRKLSNLIIDSLPYINIPVFSIEKIFKDFDVVGSSKRSCFTLNSILQISLVEVKPVYHLLGIMATALSEVQLT